MKNVNETIKIHVLHCGEVGVDPAVPYRDVSNNLIAYTGLFRSSKRRIWLPVSAYLIEHPKGLLLFDTGWHSDVRTNPVWHESKTLYFASKPRLPDGQAVNEQLQMLGYKSSDLDYVFLSHLDVDHVSGVGLVKDARNIMVSREEILAGNSRQIRYNKKLWKDVELKSYDYADSKVGPIQRAFDIFGDESVLLVSTPGHSQGSATMYIQNNDKYALLTGDTGYAKDSWEKLRLPGPIYDKEAMKNSLEWVKYMANQKECVGVLASHDTEITTHIIEL